MILLYCTQLHFDLTPFRANPPLIPAMIQRLILSKSSIEWCFYLRSNWILKSHFLTSGPKLVSTYVLGKPLKNNDLAYHFGISFLLYFNMLYV